MKTLADFDWRGKTAVVRADLNVPLLPEGGVADAARLEAVAPTVKYVLEGGGGVALLSHLGGGYPMRKPWQNMDGTAPREVHSESAFMPDCGIDEVLRVSLQHVAPVLAKALGREVRFCDRLEGKPLPGEVVLHENTRFNVGEIGGAAELSEKLAPCYAALGDVFVMDAFATAHRADTSVVRLASAGLLPACAGLLVEKELAALRRVVARVERPLVGVFGGAKISSKLAVLRRMAELCDVLIVGGGMANTLLLARGERVGASLVQRDMLDAAREVMAAAGDKLLLPVDAVARAGAEDAAGREARLDEVGENDQIVDIGSASAAAARAALLRAKTILWNGPVGLFETPAFASGTKAVAQAVADATAGGAYSLLGGGDTIAAARAAGVLARVSYVSTGGGALLEYLAGERLPGLAAIGAYL